MLHLNKLKGEGGLKSFLCKKENSLLTSDHELSKENVDKSATAHVVGWVSCYEDTHIVYYYVVDNVEYGFYYLTPWDESHRGWGDHPREWYDVLTPGHVFQVKYWSEDPRYHVVLDENLKNLNKSYTSFLKHTHKK